MLPLNEHLFFAANPMYGKYDPFKNITENVNFQFHFTRFDLIFVVRDIPGKNVMKNCKTHYRITYPQGTDKKSVVDVDLLTKYLSY